MHRSSVLECGRDVSSARRKAIQAVHTFSPLQRFFFFFYIYIIQTAVQLQPSDSEKSSSEAVVSVVQSQTVLFASDDVDDTYIS